MAFFGFFHALEDFRETNEIFAVLGFIQSTLDKH